MNSSRPTAWDALAVGMIAVISVAALEALALARSHYDLVGLASSDAITKGQIVCIAVVAGIAAVSIPASFRIWRAWPYIALGIALILGSIGTFFYVPSLAADVIVREVAKSGHYPPPGIATFFANALEVLSSGEVICSAALAGGAMCLTGAAAKLRHRTAVGRGLAAAGVVVAVAILWAIAWVIAFVE